MNIPPGVYFDMPMADYLAIPAVSNGVLQTLLGRCPAAAWYCSPFNPQRPREDTDAGDAGTIAHAIFLEGSRDCLCVIDPADHPAEKTRAIPKGWTNKSIRAARDAARAAGKIPALPEDVAEIDALVNAATRFVESLCYTEPAIWQMMQPDDDENITTLRDTESQTIKVCYGRSEVVMIWREGDTLCKLRADRISAGSDIVLDYKTSDRSVEPAAWARTMLDYMGAAWYRRGVKATTGVEPDYVFLAGERAPPYLHSLIGVLPADLALGAEKCEAALRRWQECERTGVWEGYPNRVAYADVPAWHRAKWDEQNGGDGLPTDLSTIFRKDKA